MKKTVRIIPLLLILCMCLSMGLTAGAEETKKERVIFSATEPDNSGYFNVTMTVYDASFNVFQFALSYNTATVMPVNQNGGKATSFEDFAHKAEHTDWMDTIGLSVDTNTGFIEFTGYASPSLRGKKPVNAAGNVEADSQGVALFVFRFKVISAGSCGLKLATAGDAVYSKSIPGGGGLADAGKWLPTKVEFSMPANLAPPVTKTTTGDNTTKKEEKPTLTADDLLKRSILLQIGNYAAVVQGGVTSIYSGEREVVPYIAEDRTMIPVRFLAERFDAVVDWDNTTRTVMIKAKGKNIQMPVGSTTYTVDGVSKTMEVAPVIVKDRTMVPIRFVAEALGYRVEWDQATRFVIVSEQDTIWTLSGNTEQSAIKKAGGLLAMYQNFI